MKWYAGLYFCKIFKVDCLNLVLSFNILLQFLQTYSLTSSNYMLVAIAIDRHRAITCPLKAPSPGSPFWLVASTWMVSLIPSLPCLWTFQLEYGQSEVEQLISGCRLSTANDRFNELFYQPPFCTFISNHFYHSKGS